MIERSPTGKVRDVGATLRDHNGRIYEWYGLKEARQPYWFHRPDAALYYSPACVEMAGAARRRPNSEFRGAYDDAESSDEADSQPYAARA